MATKMQPSQMPSLAGAIALFGEHGDLSWDSVVAVLLAWDTEGLQFNGFENARGRHKAFARTVRKRALAGEFTA